MTGCSPTDLPESLLLIFSLSQSLWTYQWHEINEIEETQRGIQFKVKGDGKRMLGLFASNEAPNKLVLVPDERKRSALHEVIRTHYKDSRYSTRMPSSRYSNLNFK